MKLSFTILPISIVLLLSFLPTYAQQPLELQLQKRSEIVVSVELNDLQVLGDLGSYSIEPMENGRYMVYLNSDQYHEFQKNDVAFIPEIAPSMLHSAKMANVKSEMNNWDAYPSYEIYLEMMYAFATDYPDVCMLDTIGFSNDGRLLLAVKISDNVQQNESEPEFFYTSSMHGDELTGYVLTLRLIDYLLTHIDDEQVQNLVNNVEIYINPLANPDGTYRYDNSTVFGATRGNINGIDLNRNFPDPKGGDHPDGKAWQAENIAMMDFMKERNFVMSMNFHGGAEVINYPWDTYSWRHADTEWFELICREYADLVHEVDNTYLTDLDNGVTNGYDWYLVEGGRQDYVTYFLNGREVIAEISAVKLPDASLLPDFWDKNYVSLLKYMENTLYGVTGQVSDENNQPIGAKITVEDHDIDNSFIYTVEDGMFYRYLKAGTYAFIFEAEGYDAKRIENVLVEDYEQTNLMVQFKKEVAISDNTFGGFKVSPNPAQNYINIESPENFDGKLNIYNALGQKVFSKSLIEDKTFMISTSRLSPGIYYLNIQQKGQMFVKKLIIQK